MRYIEPMAKLIEHFRALPGIGSKTAVRLAYHILDMEPAQQKPWRRLLLKLKKKLAFAVVVLISVIQTPVLFVHHQIEIILLLCSRTS